MPYSHRLHPLAKQDIIEAYEWYEDKKKGLGDRFADSVSKLIMNITKTPEIFGSKDKIYFREATLKDFPYIIVYKVLEHKKDIFISSVHHVKKHPIKKYRR